MESGEPKTDWTSLLIKRSARQGIETELMWNASETGKTWASRRLLARQHPHEDKQTPDTERKVKYMIKPSKAMIAGAAVAGLLTGSFAVRAYAASTSGHAGVSLQTMADAEKGKHACKGQNECKGQGGCKTSDAGCKGKNSCKGKGGCATDGTKPPQIF
jgi:hypothetical protein